MAVVGEAQRTVGRDRGSFAKQRDIDEFVETLAGTKTAKSRPTTGDVSACCEAPTASGRTACR